MFLIVVAALYAVASTWVTLDRMARVDAAKVATLRAEEARTILQELLASVLDIETATHGFSLSGDPTMLAPFEDGRVRAPQLLDRLRDQMRDDFQQLARMEQLTRFLAERIVLSEFIIERKRTQPEGSAAALQFGGRAAAATKGIRDILGEIDAEGRERLAAAKSAWSRELDAARTIEIASCALAFVIIAFALLALVRWRKQSATSTSVTADVGADELAARTPAGATAGVRNGGRIGALLEEALQRTELVQKSYPATSGDCAPVEALRREIDNALEAHARMKKDLMVPELQRLGLPAALQQLVERARKRGSGVIRESFDVGLPSPPPAQAYLLYRAAEWALDVICGRARDGEIGIALASHDGRIALRIESRGKRGVELTPAEKRQADGIAAAVAAAGGTWQWTDGDGGGVTALLAQIPQDPAAEAVPSPCPDAAANGSGKADTMPS